MNELLLTYRYTTVTANSSQTTPENSLGGYTSTNNIYTQTTASGRVSRDASLITVASLPTVTSGLSQLELEVIKYAGTDTTNSQLTNITRGLVPNIGPSYGFPHGEIPRVPVVRYLDINNLFDPKFDRTYEQYRCITIRNDSSVVAENVKPILIEDSSSDIDIDIAIEVPSHDYHTGLITTATSTLILVDAAMAGLYSDNFFAGSLLRMTSGAAATNATPITSFDGTTGTFVLSSSPGAFVAGDLFEIEPAPSQQVVNGATAPINTSYFFGFLEDGGLSDLGYNNVRENGDLFRQYDHFYIWIKRTLAKNKKSKDG